MTLGVRHMKMVNNSSIALLVIAGGKSRRMGHDKRWLKWQGKSFLDCIVRKAIIAGFSEIIICAETASPEIMKLSQKYSFVEFVFDEIEGFGPMEGLHQGLKHMNADYGWAVSCDMPFFDFQSAKKLLHINEEKSPLAIVPLTEGRWQPLASIYSKNILSLVEQKIKNGDGRMKSIMLEKDILKVDCTEIKEIFFNVNNEGDYRMALARDTNMKRNTPLISISATQSNTGKTSFIEMLIKELSSIDLKCGVIKHTHHEITAEDEDGKDSQRFLLAGAEAVAVISPNSYYIKTTLGLVEENKECVSIEDIAEKVENVDVILVETRSHGIFPVVNLYREIATVNTDEKTVALFTSKLIQETKVNQYNINDKDSARCLIRFIAGY